MLTKAERTKQFILETAAPLYNEKGISGVSIENVLSATKLTKGCIYGHFENKEDLSEQVVDLLLTKITSRVDQVFSQGKTVKAKLHAFLDFYRDPIQTYISGGCPVFNTAVDADDNYPKIKEKVAKVLRLGQEKLSDLLKQGIDSGEFSTELNPVVFAFKMVAAIEGGTVLCRTMGVTKPMHDLIKDLKSELSRYER